MWTDSRNLAGETMFILPVANLLNGNKEQQGLCSLTALPDVLLPDGAGYRWDTGKYNAYAEEGSRTWVTAVLRKAGMPKSDIEDTVSLLLQAEHADYSLNLQQLSPVTVSEENSVITYRMGEQTDAVWVAITLTPTDVEKVTVSDDRRLFPDLSYDNVLRRLAAFEGFDMASLDGYGLGSGEGENNLTPAIPSAPSDIEDLDLSGLETLLPSPVTEFDNNLLYPSESASPSPSS
jgi:hypothetical protein